jgi:Derlin-2/3
MDFGVGGGGNIGDGLQFPLEQWYFEMPVCTRFWTTAVVATSVLVQCKVLSPFNLFYSAPAVFNRGQVSLNL